MNNFKNTDNTSESFIEKTTVDRKDISYTFLKCASKILTHLIKLGQCSPCYIEDACFSPNYSRITFFINSTGGIMHSWQAEKQLNQLSQTFKKNIGSMLKLSEMPKISFSIGIQKRAGNEKI